MIRRTQLEREGKQTNRQTDKQAGRHAGSQSVSQPGVTVRGGGGGVVVVKSMPDTHSPMTFYSYLQVTDPR